ncbi:MAG: hypothetical protein ABJE10_14845 [bacterium]
MDTAIFSLFELAMFGAPAALLAALVLCVRPAYRSLGLGMLRSGLWVAIAGVALSLTVAAVSNTWSQPWLIVIPAALAFFIGSVGGLLLRGLSSRVVVTPRLKWGLLLGGAIIAIFAWVPFNSVVAPAVQLVLVDSSGARVPGACALESWEHYSVERTAHDDERRADGRGIVAFPTRMIRASIAQRVARPLEFVALGMVPIHASFGPSSTVTVWATGLKGGAGPLQPGTTRVVMSREWQQPNSRTVETCGVPSSS